MNRCAWVLVSLQHTQKFHPKDLELHVTQLFKNSLLITSVLWVFNQIFFALANTAWCLRSKVVIAPLVLHTFSIEVQETSQVLVDVTWNSNYWKIISPKQELVSSSYAFNHFGKPLMSGFGKNERFT